MGGKAVNEVLAKSRLAGSEHKELTRLSVAPFNAAKALQELRTRLGVSAPDAESTAQRATVAFKSAKRFLSAAAVCRVLYNMSGAQQVREAQSWLPRADGLPAALVQALRQAAQPQGSKALPKAADK